MKSVVKVLGWLCIPFVMLWLEWKSLGKFGKMLGSIWLAVWLVIGISGQMQEKKEEGAKMEKEAATVGASIDAFKKQYGKGQDNGGGLMTFKGGEVFVIFADGKAFNVSHSFEDGEGKRVKLSTAEKTAEAWIPQDATLRKGWYEDDIFFRYYESETVAAAFAELGVKGFTIQFNGAGADQVFSVALTVGDEDDGGE